MILQCHLPSQAVCFSFAYFLGSQKEKKKITSSLENLKGIGLIVNIWCYDDSIAYHYAKIARV